MTAATRCNFCYLDDMKHFAEGIGASLTLHEERGGIEVRINNTMAAWFQSLPPECVCLGMTVHILRAGRALCGLTGFPRDWPPSHRWVPEADADAATCHACCFTHIVMAQGRPGFRCPDCDSHEFLEGPHGGMSINFCCRQCGARFNDCVGWIDRTQADGDERESWAQPFIPRANYLRG